MKRLRGNKRRRGGARGDGGRSSGPVHVILSNDGEPFTGDCSCPICAEAARTGAAIHTLDETGALVEVTPARPPPMMEVVVRGEGSLAAVESPLPVLLEVPVGCVAMDLVLYLGWRFPAIRRLAPEGCVAVVEGEECDPQQVILPGDVVTLHVPSIN